MSKNNNQFTNPLKNVKAVKDANGALVKTNRGNPVGGKRKAPKKC